MLEYMTLCADPYLFESGSTPQQYPAPSGIPMSIVILPDFVVDLAIESVAADRGHRGPLDVGGRSGRLAVVLQTFGGQKNGWYQIKYVAKAGDIGRVVLKRRFARSEAVQNSDPVSLRYIVPAKRQFDWFNVYGGMTHVESASAGLSLGVSDFDDSGMSLADLLKDVRYIVISSKHADHAISAISVVAEGIRRFSDLMHNPKNSGVDLPLGIMLDLSALSDPGEAGRVVESFNALNQGQSVFDIESTALCEPANIFAQEHFKNILTRSNNAVRLGNESFQLSIEGPVAREAFTAGYVLASACNLGWKLLRRWFCKFPKSRPIDGTGHDDYPKASDVLEQRQTEDCHPLPTLNPNVGDPIAASERVRYATLLANATNSSPIHYSTLIRSAAEQSDKTELSKVAALENQFASSSPEAISKILAGLEEIPVEGHLVPRFLEPKTTLSLFVPPSNLHELASSCFVRDARRLLGKQDVEVSKVVMFDLDATLVDSEGLRQACWFKALQTFFRESNFLVTHKEILTAIDIYQAFIYDRYEGFRTVLKDHPDIPPEWQPCDFRQVWNHRYAWAAFITVLEKIQSDPEKWAESLKSIWPSILKDHSKDHGCICTGCLQLQPLPTETKETDEEEVREQLEDRRQFCQALRSNLTRFRFAIQAARTAFWEVEYPPYPQARSCVEMLRATPGCEVYVVTEGDENTQVRKLICTGLDDLFPRNRVLSTGAASAAEGARTNLLRLLMVAKGALKDLEAAEKKMQETQGNLSVIKAPIDNYKATVDSLSFFMDCLHALAAKGHRKFYSVVIDAIRRNPGAPSTALNSFLKHPLGASDPRHSSSMQFFMIGDRYDNDCRPLLDMFPVKAEARARVGTCRLLSGKRAKKFYPPGNGHPATLYVCDTLAQFANIMHLSSSWNAIEPLGEITPPVLLELKNNVILYGPRETAGDLEAISVRIKALAWAKQDASLEKQQSVQEMLDQIERDLALFDGKSLAIFLCSVLKEVDGWLSSALGNEQMAAMKADAGTAVNPETALILLKGFFKLMTGLNWWRRRFRQPEIEHFDHRNCLEWWMGGLLLKTINKSMLNLPHLGILYRARVPSEISSDDLLGALPKSNVSLEIIQALIPDAGIPIALQKKLSDWRDKSVFDVSSDSI